MNTFTGYPFHLLGQGFDPSQLDPLNSTAKKCRERGYLSCTELRFPRIAAKSLLAMQRACQRCIYPELVRRNHARSACAVRR